MVDVGSDLSLWFFSNAGQIITIILFTAGGIRYLEGRTNKKIDDCYTNLSSDMNAKVDGLKKDICNLEKTIDFKLGAINANNATVIQFMQKGIDELKQTVTNLRERHHDYATR